MNTLRKSSLTIMTSLSLALLCAVAVFPQTPAFPEAQGAGMFTSGGRGGDVYHVTILDDNKNNPVAGSLRYGIRTVPAQGRTIVFDISGTIHLKADLKIEAGNLTIAGQTAPGKGVCLAVFKTQIFTNNVIVRHLRFRPDQRVAGAVGDVFDILGNRVILDHCSFSWSSDEVLSTADDTATYDITAQWCLVYEGLSTSYHYENGVLIEHSMGSLISSNKDGAQLSWHHNLYAHNTTRNPKPTLGVPNATIRFEFSNNVVYDWGEKCGYSSDDTTHFITMNYIGNYCVAGPSTQASRTAKAFYGLTKSTSMYQDGNKIDSDRDAMHDGENTGWNMFDTPITRRAARFDFPAVSAESADSAYARVLRTGGAFFWNRDDADTRIVNEVRARSGRIIDSVSQVGGWPVLPTESRPAGWDSDLDGMPDAWERQQGLDPQQASDRNITNTQGYTNLERYLNAIPLGVVATTETPAFNKSPIRRPASSRLVLVQTGTILSPRRSGPESSRLLVHDLRGRLVAALIDDGHCAVKRMPFPSGKKTEAGVYIISER